MNFITKDEFLTRYQKEILPELMHFEQERIKIVKKGQFYLISSIIFFVPIIIVLIIHFLSQYESFSCYHKMYLLKEFLLEQPIFVFSLLGSLIFSPYLFAKSLMYKPSKNFQSKIKQNFYTRILNLLGNISWEQKNKETIISIEDDYIKGAINNINFSMTDIIKTNKRNLYSEICLKIDLNIDLKNLDTSKQNEIKNLTKSLKKIFNAYEITYTYYDEQIKLRILTNSPQFELINIKKTLNDLYMIEEIYNRIHAIYQTINVFKK